MKASVATRVATAEEPPVSPASPPADRNSIVSVSHLGKSYGSRQALRDVTFELGPGITGLLGPNGAGKSTLMRCLAGLIGWDAGEVRIEGVDPTWQPGVRRRVGFMPERVSFPAEMRLEEYLGFVSQMKGIPRAVRGDAVERALQRVGLDDARRRIIGNLSKGYRQRVGLAQALLGDPVIALLDEPSAGLDPLNVLETREVLREYARERAVLISTHVLPEARLLCDRVMIVSRGSILYHGDLSELTNVSVEPTTMDALEYAFREAVLGDDSGEGNP